MRGQDIQQAALFSYLSPEERVPAAHPLRPIRGYVDAALVALSPHLEALPARTGRPSIAPEKLLRALLLQVLYRIRSERRLREHLAYNLLFHWLVGLALDAPVWDVTVFTKTGTGCWTARWPRPFSNACWPKRGLTACCSTNTSRSMVP